MVKTSSYSIIFDFVFCIAGIITILSAKNYFEKFNGILDEFYTIVLMSISGMLIISHSNDLIMIFIGIEIMSICFYVLTGIIKKDLKGNESSVKYFLLGAFATGFLMYGIALLYGSFGSTNFTQISANFFEKYSLLTICGFSLIIIGFSFKVGIFPFHQWVPDVYEGAPTIVTGFMSTAGKAAAFSGFVGVMSVIYPKLNSTDLTLVIAILSAITMLSGNILALSQTNIKRMLAYSSISHAGYALMGIASGNKMGYIGVLYYMCSYLFMQLGAFVVIGKLENSKGEYIQVKDYIGLGKTNPVIALILSLFMLSLLGIPPFAGFFSKDEILWNAFANPHGSKILWAIGFVTAMMTAFYMSRMFYLTFMGKPRFDEAKMGAHGHDDHALSLIHI